MPGDSKPDEPVKKIQGLKYNHSYLDEIAEFAACGLQPLEKTKPDQRSDEALVVPLVVYNGGERKVIGNARIVGNVIFGEIYENLDSNLADMVRGNDIYTGASFSFGKPNPEGVLYKKQR